MDNMVRNTTPKHKNTETFLHVNNWRIFGQKILEVNLNIPTNKILNYTAYPIDRLTVANKLTVAYIIEKTSHLLQYSGTETLKQMLSRNTRDYNFIPPITEYGDRIDIKNTHVTPADALMFFAFNYWQNQSIPNEVIPCKHNDNNEVYIINGNENGIYIYPYRALKK
jgi:hypothetical protein